MKPCSDLGIPSYLLILSCPAESGAQRRLAGVHAQYAPKLSHGGRCPAPPALTDVILLCGDEIRRSVAATSTSCRWPSYRRRADNAGEPMQRTGTWIIEPHGDHLGSASMPASEDFHPHHRTWAVR
jgi:hypothetical protein